MHFLFYGTIMRGGAFHHLLKDSQFLGEGSFTGNLYWHRSGIPYAKLDQDGLVHGEIYEVPEELVPRLDSLEGHPTWYRRVVVKLLEGFAAWVYIYQGSVEGMEKVPEGRYSIHKPIDAPPSASSASSGPLAPTQS